MNHNPIPAELLNRKAQTLLLIAGLVPGPICGIYLIRHRATGKAYVGQSIHVTKRWADHRTAGGDTHLARAIRRHGPDAFDFEILVTCPRADLNDLEAYFIDQCRTLSPRGYNLLSGGGQGQEVTAEVREKLSESRKNSEAYKAATSSPEHKAKLSEAQKASEASREHLARLHADPAVREKLRESVRLRCADPEWQAKNREQLARINADPTSRERHRAAMRARGDQRAPTLIHVKTGAVAVGLRYELSERLGINSSGLADLVHGRLKTTGGYRLARPDELPVGHAATDPTAGGTIPGPSIPSPTPTDSLGRSQP